MADLVRALVLLLFKLCLFGSEPCQLHNENGPWDAPIIQQDVSGKPAHDSSTTPV